MSPHAIGRFQFEFWRGDEPSHPREQVQAFSRAGAAGVAHRTLGKRAATITAELTSWHASYAIARAAVPLMVALAGTTQDVIHETINLKAAFNLAYVVEAVDLVSCEAHVRLVGPGINYPSGAALVTRWTLTPIDLRDIAES